MKTIKDYTSFINNNDSIDYYKNISESIKNWLYKFKTEEEMIRTLGTNWRTIYMNTDQDRVFSFTPKMDYCCFYHKLVYQSVL